MTPWWEALKLRDEVASGAGQIDDVQMSLFNAIKGTVPYATPPTTARSPTPPQTSST